MIARIAYYNLLGLSTIIWLGIVTYLCLLITALTAILRKKGIRISLKLHTTFAAVSISLATIHAALVIFSR
jgi:hypothetical protein